LFLFNGSISLQFYLVFIVSWSGGMLPSASAASSAGRLRRCRHDNNHQFMLVLIGEKQVHIAPKSADVPGSHEGGDTTRVYPEFTPHKWYMAGFEDNLCSLHRFTRHVVKAGQSIIIPSGAPHFLHSIPNTVAVNVNIDHHIGLPTTLCRVSLFNPPSSTATIKTSDTHSHDFLGGSV